MTAPTTEPAPAGSEEPGLRKRRSPWPWITLGVVCAIGLGIFMWAVGGRWNLNAPRPSGPAATPQQAVEKYMAAVDNHDGKLVEVYTTGAAREQLSAQMDPVGYLRFVSADVTGRRRSEMVLRVTFDEATTFLNSENPVGLNLAALVWTERLTRFFGVVPTPDRSGWLVDQAFATEL